MCVLGGDPYGFKGVGEGCKDYEYILVGSDGGLDWLFESTTIIYSLTARVVLAPQVISQPISSICPCSPLPSRTLRLRLFTMVKRSSWGPIACCILPIIHNVEYHIMAG